MSTATRPPSGRGQQSAAGRRHAVRVPTASSGPGRISGAGGGNGRPPAAARVRLGDPRRRLRFVAGLIAFLLLLLSFRLIQLQGVDSRRYALQADGQLVSHIPLPATRGTITDRNGVPLAEDIDAKDVVADPILIDSPLPTAQALAPILHKSVSDLYAQLVARTGYIVVGKGVTPAAGTAIMAKKLPGITVSPSTRRFYPGGDLAAQLLGFASSSGTDIVGRAGLESQLNSLLSGTPGSLTFEHDPQGRQIPAGEHREKAAVQGTNVQLTLNRDIQWAAQSAIAAQVAATRAAGGYAIVLNPRNGQIYAMANAPTFNANTAAAGTVPEWALSDPVVTSAYEPGSVAKVATIGMALQKGLVTPTTPFNVPDSLQVGGYTVHDSEGVGGHYTLAGVLAKSSNLGTVAVAAKFGNNQAVSDAMNAFGLGLPTGLKGVSGESPGYVPAGRTWLPIQAANIPFGQGMSATALQIAMMYATIANGGVHVAPSIIESTQQPGHARKPEPAGPTRRVISAATAKTLSQILEMVVRPGGTAPKVAIPGYRVAGKTGTAQRADPGGGYGGQWTSSFVGFAPADNPQVLVETVVIEPQTAHLGADVAGPAFDKIMEFALSKLGIAPTNTTPPNYPLELP